MRVRYFVFVSLVLCVLAFASLALSKPSKKSGPAKTSAIDKKLVSTKVTPKIVLRRHAQYYERVDEGARRFEGPTVAYVTPWNRDGYRVAEVFAAKFDIISPVWFRLQVPVTNGPWVDGTQDIDKEWIERVRESGKAGGNQPKIMPRFVHEGWANEVFQAWVSERSMVDDIVLRILATCVEFDFDGIVLDTSYHGLAGDSDRIYYVEQLGMALHQHNKQLIWVAPAHPELFTAGDFNHISSFVDHVALMTYDYSNPSHPGPSSPLWWSEQTVFHLIPPSRRTDKEFTRKLLLGMNFYANDFVLPVGGGPIVGNTVLEILREHSPSDIVWDASNHEHHFQYKKRTDDDLIEKHHVYFPTLQYIQDRVDLASDSGCGVALWEIGQGMDYFMDLL